MNDIDRELLLGYLLNALEEHEIALVERELMRQPDLRLELASLQKELSPLSYVYESVDPPRNLARRTCDRIWAMADREERLGQPADQAELPTRIISVSFSHLPVQDSSVADHSKALKEMLAVSSPRDVSQGVNSSPSPHPSPTNGRRLSRRHPSKNALLSHPDRSTSPVPQKQGKRRRIYDILLSVGVGILIAFVAFPAINYARNRAVTMVAQNKIKEINQSVGLYTQLQNDAAAAKSDEEPSGFNLAQSGWQEVVPNQVPMLLVGNHSQVDVSPDPTIFGSQADLQAIPQPLSQFVSADDHTVPAFGQVQGRDILLGQSPDTPSGQWISRDIDPRGLAYQTLMTNVGHVVPIDNGSTIQTAFGQNVLFQNGKIFFRVLPVFHTPTEQESAKKF